MRMEGHTTMQDMSSRKMDNLYLEVQDKIKGLYQAIRDYTSLGLRMNQAKADYEIEYSKRYLIERSKGRSNAEIDNTLDGNEEMAALKQMYKNLEVQYASQQELINAIKLDVRTTENELNREYGVEGKQL